MPLPYPRVPDPEIDANFRELDTRVGVITSTGTLPSGAAGGVLDGTYPDPGLNGSVAGFGLDEASNVLAVVLADFSLSGTHAARPVAGTAGRTYFETDTGVLYRDTGAAWVAQAPGMIHMSANQTLTQSSTTLQNVTELALPVEAGENWFAEVFLFLTANSTSDWKFGWTGPTGAAMFWGVFGSSAVTPGNWNAVDIATAPGGRLSIAATASIGGATGGTTLVHLAGLIRNPTNAGTIQLQAAQDTATAIDNVIAADSWMRVTRLV